MITLKELYRIGQGPSSSHTMGPRKAAEQFLAQHPDACRFEVTPYPAHRHSPRPAPQRQYPAAGRSNFGTGCCHGKTVIAESAKQGTGQDPAFHHPPAGSAVALLSGAPSATSLSHTDTVVFDYIPASLQACNRRLFLSASEYKYVVFVTKRPHVPEWENPHESY